MLKKNMDSHRRNSNRNKLFLTCIEFLDKFKGEVQSLFHQVVDVRSQDAVGLRADFYACGVRCPVVVREFSGKPLKLGLQALTETVLAHRLQGIGLRGRHVNEDGPDRRRGHLALRTNESILRELLIP